MRGGFAQLFSCHGKIPELPFCLQYWGVLGQPKWFCDSVTSGRNLLSSYQTWLGAQPLLLRAPTSAQCHLMFKPERSLFLDKAFQQRMDFINQSHQTHFKTIMKTCWFRDTNSREVFGSISNQRLNSTRGFPSLKAQKCLYKHRMSFTAGDYTVT